MNGVYSNIVSVGVVGRIRAKNILNLLINEIKLFIYIEGDQYIYRPFKDSDGSEFVVGDIAVLGHQAVDKFNKILVYNGGDPELYTGWDVIESI